LRIKESFSILYHYIPELASHSCLNWRKDPDQPFGTNGWSRSLRLFSRTGTKKRPKKWKNSVDGGINPATPTTKYSFCL
ncbi:hypothetical protein, partial [Pseudoflavonifractor sp. An85]|uniref:hypothetical protein n=1 Tax=Pseudoflavonifractor sp. An85 TaxID=1965661 RepID=UPI0019508735